MYIDDLLAQSLRARKDSTLGDEVKISLVVPETVAQSTCRAREREQRNEFIVKTKRLCTVKMSREQIPCLYVVSSSLSSKRS